MNHSLFKTIGSVAVNFERAIERVSVKQSHTAAKRPKTGKRPKRGSLFTTAKLLRACLKQSKTSNFHEP